MAATGKGGFFIPDADPIFSQVFATKAVETAWPTNGTEIRPERHNFLSNGTAAETCDR